MLSPQWQTLFLGVNHKSPQVPWAVNCSVSDVLITPLSSPVTSEFVRTDRNLQSSSQSRPVAKQYIATLGKQLRYAWTEGIKAILIGVTRLLQLVLYLEHGFIVYTWTSSREIRWIVYRHIHWHMKQIVRTLFCVFRVRIVINSVYINT